MRKLVLFPLLALGLAVGLSGCVHTAEFKHPQTGATGTCAPWPLAEINPWSSYHLCLEEYVSEGYTRVK